MQNANQADEARPPADLEPVYVLPGERSVLAVRGYENDFAGLPDAVQQLRARLKEAVDAERAEQRRAAQQMFTAGSLQRLQAEGVALGGLEGRPEGVLFRSTIWTFRLPHQGDLPAHR